MDTKKKNWLVTAVLFCVFVAYTAVVKFVDVGFGLEGTELGLSTINHACEKMFPFKSFWYDLTEYLGYAALGVCLAFALLGLVQLIKGRSLKKVDKEIWILAGFYVVVLAFYVLFEKLIINYRPVILDEGLEASYPSSHTVLAACVYISAFFMFMKYVKNKTLLACLQGLCVLAAVLTIVGRLFSGVHWVSDIVGGLLLSAALIHGFLVAIKAK